MGKGEGGATYDFEGVLHDPNSHQLLSVVAAVHHQGVGQALDDGTLGFSEALDGVAAGGVGDVDRGADLNVVAVVEKNVSTRIKFPRPLNLESNPQPIAAFVYMEAMETHVKEISLISTSS